MPRPLTRAERKLLATLSTEETNMGGQWKASRTFLALYDLDLVDMRLRSRSDVACGPGYHGSDWMIRKIGVR